MDTETAFIEQARILSKKLAPEHLQEDAYGEAGTVYRKSVMTYAPDKGSYKTYAAKLITNAIFDFLRKETLHTEREVNLEYVDEIEDPETNDAESAVIEAQRISLLHDAIESIRPSLNIRQMTILEERILAADQRTLRDLAQQFGYSKDYIAKEEAELVNKIKGAISYETIRELANY